MYSYNILAINRTKELKAEKRYSMNRFKYKIISKCCCDQKECRECCHNCCDQKEYEECCCSQKNCKKCCCKEESCKMQRACVDIMQSIANVETALSHILNAEGEKIQEAIKTTDNIEDILRINREVNKTIINVTHLEHVVFAKLNALIESGLCCNLCCEQKNNG